jgi:hypothetical protein
LFCLSEIIKNKPKFVGEAAVKWLERYEDNPVDGLNELLLTMFEVGDCFLEDLVLMFLFVQSWL